MFVDYENSVLRLGLLDEEALPQAAISSGSCNRSGLSQEAKGLIGTGVAVFLVMVAVGLLTWFFLRRLREREARLSEHEALLGSQGEELKKTQYELRELRARPPAQALPPRADSPTISHTGTD
jgi:type II secretory pathway component PulM